MVNEEIDKLLTDEGITAKFTIKKRKEVLEKAIEKNDLTNANRVLDSFEEKLDMKPKEIKFQQTTQIDYKKYLEGYDKKELGEGDSEGE